MAFFTSTSTAPKVYLESDNRQETVTITTNIGVLVYNRLITTSRYEYRGMTRASAESAAASLVSATVTAKAERENDANAWKVSVVEQTIGAWS
jgi:hypothetical protein